MWAVAIASDGYTFVGPGFVAMIAGSGDYLWFVNRCLECVCRIHIDGTDLPLDAAVDSGVGQ